MSDNETNQENSPKILLLPCAGVEKIMGQITALASAEVVNLNLIPNLKVQPSIQQIAADSEDHYNKNWKMEKNIQTIALNGCNLQCVNKILESKKIPISRSLNITPFLKKLQFNPKNKQKISMDEINIATKAAELISNEIQDYLKQILGSKSKLNSKSNQESNEILTFSPKFDDLKEFVHTKFIFKVPQANNRLFFTWNDTWAYLQDEIAFIGITDYMQKTLADILFVNLPEIGQKIEQLEELGSVESTKSVFDVLSPFSGLVIQINEKILEEPDRINDSPYQNGWICAIKYSNKEEEIENLMTPKDYFKDMKIKIQESDH
ncbi:MAG: glycine cleavage system protein GcvH [Promethearchaeota archaeon]